MLALSVIKGTCVSERLTTGSSKVESAGQRIPNQVRSRVNTLDPVSTLLRLTKTDILILSQNINGIREKNQ